MQQNLSPFYSRWLIFFWSMTAVSCSISRSIPEGESYFKSQRLVIHDKPENFEVTNDELMALTKVQPNRRILWLRFNARVYCWLVPKEALARSEIRSAQRCGPKNKKRTKKGKSTKECKSLWMWLAYTVGEKPALVDSARILKGGEQMNVLLMKDGYFNNTVQTEFNYSDSGMVFWRDRQKCNVIYHIYPGQPYHLRSIVYDIQDAGMARRKEDLLKASVLDTGAVFRVELLDKERERITDYYNNRGYYEFTKDYIVYDADSTVGSREVDIIMKLRTPMVASATDPDSLVRIPHRKYFIGNVFVNTGYNPSDPLDAPTDTLTYEGMYILSNGQPNLKPSLLNYTTSINHGEVYQKDKIDLTYKRFAQLGISKSVNIQLTPIQSVDSSGVYTLDAHVLINPARKQLFSFDPRVTNRSGNTGIYGNLVYGHKNLFRGAESLRLSIITGVEASQILGQGSVVVSSASQQIERNFRLNTFEIGPVLSLSLPRLWPFGYSVSGKSSDPHALFSATFNYQKRPDYQRTLSQVGFGWDFIENPDVSRRVNLQILELSVIKIQKSQAFEDFIARLGDAFLANSYRDHLIMATRGTFTINTQKKKVQQHYVYSRTSLESAGNLLRGAFNLTNATKDEFGSYEISGIRFAQYIKFDQDLRGYFNVNERNTFVGRAYGGIGIPYVNQRVLPFEKSFFSGGANGMRAWQARTLGPGSYRDSTATRTFNNIGDIKLEFNFEYRFKLTQMFQAALFVDAGNIWLLRLDDKRPGAQFQADRFVSEIAVGAGLGLRLDFDFFLVRLDAGLPLKDPQKIQGERWLWQPKTEYLSYLSSLSDSGTAVYKNRPVLNLGIGFPF